MVIWRIRSAPIPRMSPERFLSTTPASTAICAGKLRRRCLRKTTITQSFIANQRLLSRRTEQLWLWLLVQQGRLEHAAKSTLRRPRPHIRNRSRRNVYFCGFASPNSYGAASYIILRPEGNVLIDSPRFARTLVGRLEELGGVSLMVFSHRDDVADHEKFHKHFGCRRIIHRADSRGIDAEELIDGQEILALDKDLLVVPVPGHTRGHIVLLYRDKYLFTGDHLAWSDSRRGLIAFRDVAWYSWPEQTKSMKRLLDVRFQWVLPGHGRRGHQSEELMHQKLTECIEWMKNRN